MMTTNEMETRVVKLKAAYERLDAQTTVLWNTAKTEAEIERYNELAMKCNDALDTWVEAEAELFARWDADALDPKGAK